MQTIPQIENAVRLAEKGFHVFELRRNSKLPAIKSFTRYAGKNPAKVRAWANRECNVGISTHRYAEHEALLVVDVDVKNGKNGFQTMLKLELEGREFPPTLEHKTASGGLHLFYSCPAPVKQGTDVFGEGLDVRSKGGYVVAPGSKVNGGEYRVAVDRPIALAPDWMLEACRVRETSEPEAAPDDIDEGLAEVRAAEYLEMHAPVSIQGAHGDQTAFQVAARVKDFGVSESLAVELLTEHWNERCQPPWSSEELKAKARNAYAYGARPVGADAPEADFQPLAPEPTSAEAEPSADTEQTPFDEDAANPNGEPAPRGVVSVRALVEEFNRDFALVAVGGQTRVIMPGPTEDLAFYTEAAFHSLTANRRVRVGDKNTPISRLWLMAPNRRSYPKGVVFEPGKPAPEGAINLWNGFKPGPVDGLEPKAGHLALEMFLEHAFENVSDGDEILFNHLMGFFAHLVQRPGVKPHSALVFKGRKGVGKNALVDCVARLMPQNTRTVSNRRYLVGNFNAHLERCLLFVLDEAFWSGDKQSEGILKDLITGTHHEIERKGLDTYRVRNYTRVCILGNEEWLVPATEDERRYAVYTVSDARRLDTKFFTGMREGFEAGGDRLLLDYLKRFDLSGFDSAKPPVSEGLLDQKLESLNIVDQWLFNSLREGRVLCGQGDTWPAGRVSTNELHAACIRYCEQHNVRSRMPDARWVGRRFAALGAEKIRWQSNGEERRGLSLGSLEECRKNFQAAMGGEIPWDF
jgi:hypothetical protein